MNLSTPSKDNVAYIVEKIKEKLKMVNSSALRSEDFTEANYEDLYDLYEMVMKRDSFSPSEIEAIVSELGSLRK
ncbi:MULTISPECIES: DUF1128 domain-containing protein [Ureibacillus]|jgi:uncharacterized protein YfkK (UPF0435 family)|uniref:UPF0435 protein HNR36_000714 n=1 Tax=Ureibacillus thermosphaericus TaxID=51173 RepID=A0A840PVX8_URETH|nr:DUF1128 domain-containing protein [Ureibacillus thermosphaericus]MBB5148328.1 uncharacterized protein YfkK (UPF0435 family) [Ureibacillus thermosphaericus]NKZ31523.1 DUF1128 domain-containing protein [Ureibacillus thermosphaericus]